MFYHVLAEIATAGKKGGSTQVAEFDKPDLEEIKRDIVKPHLAGRPFSVDGYQIAAKDLRRLMIKRSEHRIDAVTEKLNDAIPSGVIMYISPIRALEDREHFVDVTREVTRSVTENDKDVASPATSSSKVADIVKPGTKPGADRNRVFIVHGHDDLAKAETARFVEKLGLKAIILHEQENEGKTIIEKIEEHTKVGFGIVLYTPDDVGAKADLNPNLKPRARQNVVFEHGYLIARLGRKPVVALVKGDLERPGDISGVVYIPMDAGGAWMLASAKEMKKAGLKVDLNKL